MHAKRTKNKQVPDNTTKKDISFSLRYRVICVRIDQTISKSIFCNVTLITLQNYPYLSVRIISRISKGNGEREMVLRDTDTLQYRTASYIIKMFVVIKPLTTGPMSIQRPLLKMTHIIKSLSLADLTRNTLYICNSYMPICLSGLKAVLPQMNVNPVGGDHIICGIRARIFDEICLGGSHCITSE